MKIFNFGLDIQPGKYKYTTTCFDELVKKFSPKKTTYYTVEFITDSIEHADAVVFDNRKRFDFVFLDLEKVEKRLERSPGEEEKSLLVRIQGILEKEELLCDHEFSSEEDALLRNLAFVTYKPSLGIDVVEDTNSLIKKILDKAGILLFFTAGKKEVRAWEVKKGATVVEAAGRIHSDLARGFIKADVVNCRDLDKFFNMAEARAKGLVKVVDRDYIVEEGDIIEVKFSV